jgi:hypothetical protein
MEGAGMNRHSPPTIGGLLAVLLLASIPQAGAAHPQFRTEVGDYTIFLGVVPAARIAAAPDLVPRGHPVKHGANQYHVELAVVDRRTGQRIEDAVVRVTATALGLNARRVTLHRMEMAGTVTYCNYFRLQPGDFYRFDLAISRVAWATPLEVSLDYGQVVAY